MLRSSLLILASLIAFVGCKTSSLNVKVPTPAVRYAEERSAAPAIHPRGPRPSKAIPAERLAINIGTTPNDGTGDTLRTAFGKGNTNFIELYANLTTVSNTTVTLTTATTQIKTVANLAALKALTFNTNYTVVFVEEDANGFSGSYWWDATIVTADDDGNGIVALNSGTGGFERRGL